MISEFSDSHGVIAQVYDFNLAGQSVFPSPAGFNLQVGLHVNADAKTYRPHVHLPVERHVTGTSEFIHVFEGKLRVTFLDDDAKLLGEAVLTSNMAVLQIRGGHAIDTDANTRFIEVKQGPYEGQIADKRFV